MKFSSFTICCASAIMLFSCGEKKSEQPVASDSVAVVTPKEATPEIVQQEKDPDVLSIVKGIWKGEMGGKPLTVSIDSIVAGTIYGKNTLGTNTRLLKGNYTPANYDQSCAKAFEAILAEPGDDKWDGVFTILFVGYLEEIITEDGPDCTGTTYYPAEAFGSWKSNNGKLKREFELSVKKK